MPAIPVVPFVESPAGGQGRLERSSIAARSASRTARHRMDCLWANNARKASKRPLQRRGTQQPGRTRPERRRRDAGNSEGEVVEGSVLHSADRPVRVDEEPAQGTE